MQLTAAGGELLEHARRVLNAADDVKRAAQQMHDIAGMLRVGTVADPESNRLGELLALARDTHPRLKLELHHAMSGAALAEVQAASSMRPFSAHCAVFRAAVAASDLSGGRTGRGPIASMARNGTRSASCRGSGRPISARTRGSSVICLRSGRCRRQAHRSRPTTKR